MARMENELQNPIAKWPFGAATAIVMIAAGTVAANICNNLTIIDGTTVVATGNRTLDLTIYPDVEPGARLIVKTRTTGAETFTPGEGMTGTVTSGTAGKTKVAEYVYDGYKFIQTAAAVQID